MFVHFVMSLDAAYANLSAENAELRDEVIFSFLGLGDNSIR